MGGENPFSAKSTGVLKPLMAELSPRKTCNILPPLGVPWKLFLVPGISRRFFFFLRGHFLAFGDLIGEKNIFFSYDSLVTSSISLFNENRAGACPGPSFPYCRVAMATKA